MKKKKKYLIGFEDGSIFWGNNCDGIIALTTLKEVKKMLKEPSLDSNLIIFEVVQLKDKKGSGE